MTHVTLFSFDRIPFNRGANGLRIPRIRTGMSLNLTDDQIHGLIALRAASSPENSTRSPRRCGRSASSTPRHPNLAATEALCAEPSAG